MNIQEMNNNNFVNWLRTVEPDTDSLVTNGSYVNRLLCCFKRAIELQLADDQPVRFNSTRLQEFFDRVRGEGTQVDSLDQDGLVQEFQEIYVNNSPALPTLTQEPAHVPPVHNSLGTSCVVEKPAESVFKAPTHSSVVLQAQKVQFAESALELKKLQSLHKDYGRVYQAICKKKSAKEARLASRIILSKIVGAEVVDFQYKTFDFLLRMTVEHQARKLPDRQRYIDMVETLLIKGK